MIEFAASQPSAAFFTLDSLQMSNKMRQRPEGHCQAVTSSGLKLFRHDHGIYVPCR